MRRKQFEIVRTCYAGDLVDGEVIRGGPDGEEYQLRNSRVADYDANTVNLVRLDGAGFGSVGKQTLVEVIKACIEPG